MAEFKLKVKGEFKFDPMAHFIPILLMALTAWALYLAGLASLQDACTEYGARQALPTAWEHMPCSKLYRFYWFIMALECVLISGLAYVTLVNGKKLSSWRVPVVGLFAVASVLYINASNTFLNELQLDWFQEGAPRNRARATAAGAIITALVNILVVIFAGKDDDMGVEMAGSKKDKKPEGKVLEVAAAPSKEAAPVPEAQAAEVSPPVAP